MSGYNGWSNYETWLVNLWFGDCWTTEADVEETREYIESMVDEHRSKMPDWMVDLCGINHLDNYIDWNELGGHIDACEGT